MRQIKDESSWFREPPAGSQPAIIIVTNLVPLFGVYWFDWEVVTILFLFWLENVIVGFGESSLLRQTEGKNGLKPALQTRNCEASGQVDTLRFCSL
jgi:hypothetical protein